MRLRLSLPVFVVVMALTHLNFPAKPASTPAWQLVLFVLSFTAAPLLLVCILARLTHTEVTP